MSLSSKLPASYTDAGNPYTNTGLLHKAELLSKNDFNDFYSFLAENKVEIFEELYYFSDFFFCKRSYGLDSDSILLSNSTKSFWNGIIPEEGQIRNFSRENNSLTQFLQFFSFAQKDKINQASVCRLNEDSIIILCNKELTPSLVQNYNSLNATRTSNFSSAGKIESNFNSDLTNSMFNLDFSECLERCITEKLTSDGIKEEFENALNSELFARLVFFVQTPNYYAKCSKNSANLLFPAKEPLPSELLQTHLAKLYAPLFGTSSQLIRLNFIGNARNSLEAKEFLKVI